MAATAIATAASVAAQAVVLRRMLGGLEILKLIFSTIRIATASLALAGVTGGIWDLLQELLGDGLGGQISVGETCRRARLSLGALASLRVPGSIRSCDSSAAADRAARGRHHLRSRSPCA